MELYRYITFETFIDIIINNKLTLLSPQMWEDSYEGWFWKVFLESKKIDDKVDKILNTIFAQCWSKNRDSAALWSIYSYNQRAVMIETTKEKLEGLGKIYYKEIEYSKDASIDVNELVSLMTMPSSNILILSFTKKRNEFLHENEVRIFALVKENPEKLNSIDIKIPNVCDFISSVTVHPFATDWYVEIVKSVCEKYGICFYGKSDLYNLEGGDKE